ncbi:MAG: UvrD-helicase domain-containing protein [Thermoleophilia bacterium]|nr:UvrD-helicase domain-containing protein [Thermoleophilia bacterium]
MSSAAKKASVDDLLAGLNEPQSQAVQTPSGPLLVLAGAGSGKTRVLTHRVAFLIAAQGVRPQEILAITFTNKAADEMKERIETLVGPVARTMWISTFHSACARILRKEAQQLGYRRNFTIYDAPDQLRVVKRCLKDLGIDDKRFPPKGIHAVISSAKNRLVDAEAFAGMVDDFFDDTVARVYSLYQEKLFANNAMDFDDLLMRAVSLFQLLPERLDYWRSAFRHILVDEYQDTNHAQCVLVNLLGKEHRNVCVVGDDDQSIYSWRGAEVRNILDFRSDYPEATIIKLEQNYRSTQTILTAANHVVSNNPGRMQKNLWTDLGQGEKIVMAEVDDEHAEARFVAGEVARLQQEDGCKPRDMAVFYRVNAQSRVLEDLFVRYGISYRVVGGTKFYERAEIKDALAYLLVIDNPSDSISFNRVVNVPKRGIGAASLASLTRFADAEGLSLTEAAARAGEISDLRPAGEKALAGFSGLIEELAATAASSPVAETLDQVLNSSGYIASLQAERTIEAEGRIENLMELVGVAEEYGRRQPDGSLREFLQEISLYTDVDKLTEQSETVTLMTLHNAKGLEFPVVFIIGAEEGVFPHSRAIEEQNLEEERRLCYVGMTRARQRLYFTYTTSRNLYGARSYNLASRFLAEIPDDLIDFRPMAGPARAGYGKTGARPSPYLGKDISGDVPPDLARPGRDEAAAFFHPGDRVAHAVFGGGVVTAVERGGTVAVRFEDGSERKLMVEYAPLRKVSA